MSEDGFSDYFEEPNMEIQIDTLMGTSFDMRVSSTDTIREIKQRIQRVEGIPIHQQNLIFQSRELKDSRRLCDAGIRNGAVVRLVVSMKGGPISTRRLSVSCEHHMMLKELKELLETTRDEIGDKLAPGSKVSVLVFKEGDILNLLRVIENEDGSYSPYSEKPIQPPSKPTRRQSQSAMFEKLVEDADMMTKISNLRKKMEDINIKRHARHHTTASPPPTVPAAPSVSYKLLSELPSDILDNVDLDIFESSLVEEGSAAGPLWAHSETEEVALKDKHRIKSRPKASAYADTKAPKEASRVHLTRLVFSERGADSPPAPAPELALEDNQDVWEIHEPVVKHSAACKFGVLKRRQSLDYGYEGLGGEAPHNYSEVCSGNFFHVPKFVAAPSAIPPQYAPKDQELCDYYFSNGANTSTPLYGRKGKSEAEKAVGAEARGARDEQLGEGLLARHEESIEQLYGYYNLSCADGTKKKDVLPPVIKKKSRCSQCNKRLNITNIYDCRCGKIFCSQHRYSEVHHCSYDYKSEGRRILEHQNPLVTADKINRI